MKTKQLLYGTFLAAVAVFLTSPALAAEPKKPAKRPEPKEVTKKIAEFRLGGIITESPPPDFLMFGFEEERPRSLKDLLQRLKKARDDSDVVAVALTIEEPEMGWAQMQELREAILGLRAADKEVYCHVESVSNGMYMLASAATRLSIVPTGEIDLMGLYGESAYIKKLLDKIHVEADFEHIGAYKSAAEPLTREGPSEPAKEEMNWLIDDLFTQIVDGVAKNRDLSPDRVKALIDEGPFSAERALKAKLIDAVEYRGDFLKEIERKFGKSAKLTKNYGGKKGPEIDFSNPFAIFKVLGEMMRGAEEGEKEAIGVVYVDGMIVSGKSEDQLFGSRTAGSTTIRAALEKARKDDKIKAVVLRVDSPGGSALASEIMWHAAKRCADEKPLVVSMGDVAASGGYYVSVAGNTIFADPGTITGSIGVVGGKIVTKGLWDWAGVSFYEIKRGQNADLFNTNRKWDERERALVVRQMKEVYDVFTGHVKDSRGKRLKEDIDKLAGGRVYTGRLALANGLIDRIGGLEDAIKFAADEANITEYEIRVLPKPKTFLDLFMKGLGADEDGDDSSSAATARAWPITAPGMQILAPVIKQLGPARARMIARFLMRVDLLGREHVLTVLPAEMMIGGMGW
jgi:protease-4